MDGGGAGKQTDRYEAWHQRAYRQVSPVFFICQVERIEPDRGSQAGIGPRFDLFVILFSFSSKYQGDGNDQYDQKSHGDDAICRANH